MKRQLKAIVRVVLEVEDDSTWSADTNFDQIAKQAEDGVRGLLTSGNNLLAGEISRRIRGIQMVSVRVFDSSTKPSEN
jgi:hypothetical protein